MAPMIRTAKIEDVHEIASVHVSSWKTTYVGQMPQSVLDELSVPNRESQWRMVFTKPGHHILVVEDGGQISGFSSFGLSRDADSSPDTGELYAIYLTEETKGRGIGKALWEQTRDSMSSLGYSEVTLWVLDTNTRAQKFYEKVGFRQDGTEKRESFGESEMRELRYRLSVK